MDFSYLSDQRNDILEFCGKTENDMKDNVDILREWMKKQPHIPSDLLQDEFLEQHIIKNKFSIEKVKTKIESYCTSKNKPPIRYLFENYTFTPSKEPQFYVPMPCLTEDFQRVIIGKVWDEDRYDFKSDFTNLMILREFFSRYDYNLGEIHIVDMTQCSMKLITKLRANIVAEGVPFILKCHSARIKEVHIISKFGTTLMNWSKPLLPAKIASRLNVHDSIDVVATLVSPKCLPKDYGGELKTLKDLTADLDEIYAKNSDKIMEYVNTSAREELRQGGSIKEEMQGTFKKLNID